MNDGYFVNKYKYTITLSLCLSRRQTFMTHTEISENQGDDHDVDHMTLMYITRITAIGVEQGMRIDFITIKSDKSMMRMAPIT